jgi:hypothetical protein
MTITITLTLEEERKLADLARASGEDPAAHAHDVVTAYLNGVSEQGTKSFEEILASIWEGWRRSGMSDGEVDDLFEQELREARRERRLPKETPGTETRTHLITRLGSARRV